MLTILALIAQRDCVSASNENTEANNDPDRVFQRAVADVYRHAQALVSAVNSLDCETAWIERFELLGALSLATFVVKQMPHENRGDSIQRCNAMTDAVMPVLRAAPRLSARALAQLRDTPGANVTHLAPEERRLRRDDWYAEEERWVAARRLAGSLPTVEFPK